MWRRVTQRSFAWRRTTTHALQPRVNVSSSWKRLSVCAASGLVLTSAGYEHYHRPAFAEDKYSAGVPTSKVLTRNFIADAVEKAFPAVVNISIDSGFTGSNGSGFVLSSDGKVVTNAHVVARCNRYSKVQVSFPDGRKYQARIHSFDKLSDIAILEIVGEPGETFPTVALGSSSSLRPGEWVCALGSPYSLQNSVSAGIISAVARHSSELGYHLKHGEFIQTDAAINAGNSGGPLLDLDGKIVGINTMKVDGGHGISFAIPIDTASQVIDQLLKDKKVTRAYIGMQMINLNTAGLRELAKSYPDLKDGVVVKSVAPGSPAHKAGLVSGDVIVEFDGKPVKNTKDILRAVGYTVDRSIDVKIRRKDVGLKTLSVTTIPLPTSLGQ